MLNIDKIEKFKEFPSFLEYLKISSIDNLEILLPFIIIVFIFSNSIINFLLLFFIYLIANGIIQYRIDKKLFNVLKKVNNE